MTDKLSPSLIPSSVESPETSLSGPDSNIAIQVSTTPSQTLDNIDFRPKAITAPLLSSSQYAQTYVDPEEVAIKFAQRVEQKHAQEMKKSLETGIELPDKKDIPLRFKYLPKTGATYLDHASSYVARFFLAIHRFLIRLLTFIFGGRQTKRFTSASRQAALNRSQRSKLPAEKAPEVKKKKKEETRGGPGTG